MNEGWKETRAVKAGAARGGRNAPTTEVAHDGNLDTLVALLAEPLRPAAERLARNPDIRTAWAAWLAMRAERGHPRTERALKAALKVLSSLHPNPDAAYNCLDHSTDSGWQGLFQRQKSLWVALPGHAAAVAAAGVQSRGDARPPSAADLAALKDYQEQARRIMAEPKYDWADVAALIHKARDNFPHEAAVAFQDFCNRLRYGVGR